VPLERPGRYCPLLLEGDILSLARFLTLQGDQLQDPTLNASHKLSRSGASLLGTLQRGSTYGELRTAARLHRISSQDFHAFLGFLNRIGGLQRKRTAGLHLQAFQMTVQHLVLGIHYPPLCRRVAPSLLFLTLTTLRATMPVILAVGIVAILWWIAGLSSVWASFDLFGGSFLVFVMSIVLHEAMHAKVLRWNGLSPHVLQLGMHIGIVHRQSVTRVEIVSAIAGPLAGMAVCTIVASVALLSQAAALSISSLIIAVLHLGSLLPYYGDGASLTKALRERNHIHEKRSPE
jgi:hypothetical protein